VWMRYSRIRILDWNRQFNTINRELSYAQWYYVMWYYVRFLDNCVPEMLEICWLAHLVIYASGVIALAIWTDEFEAISSNYPPQSRIGTWIHDIAVSSDAS
jgi:hypothetical protein